MGPLFSLAIAALGLLALLAGVVAVLRFRHAPLPALGRAVALVAGFAIGLVAAGLLATVVVGFDHTLPTSGAVSAYLGWLSLGGLVGGWAASRLVARIG